MIVAIGSSCQTIEEYIDNNKDCNLGLIKVRLYRPFYTEEFIKTLPSSCKVITVLDRTKENGATNPLALDVMSAVLKSGKNINVLSGRYGLGGKDFTPACVNAVVNNMKQELKDNFTVGINDDKSHSSLPLEHYEYNTAMTEIKIFGLGSDGSVSASKSTVKILGEKYNKEIQGYFEYDSKKSGSMTISHLRLSDSKIKSEYLIENANVISINNFSFVPRYDCLKGLKENGIVLINSIFDSDEIGKVLPIAYVKKLQEKNAKLFIINAQKIATECGLGNKINIIMQTALLKVTKFLNDDEIISSVTEQVSKIFASKGQDVVDKNNSAVLKALSAIEEADISKLVGKTYPPLPDYENEFYKNIMKPILSLDGNSIPVSKFESDGSTELATSQYEKRGIALNLPKWIKENCIQ